MKDLSLHILDIAHNSIRAKATLIHIKVLIKSSSDQLAISIQDNGSGMIQEKVRAITDPFFTTRTTRKVDLGIPLLLQKAEECGGALLVESELGKGTTIKANFQLSHIDLPELGNLAGVISGLCCSYHQIQFIFEFEEGENEFRFDNSEIVDALGNVPINTPEVEIFIHEMIHKNMEAGKNE